MRLAKNGKTVTFEVCVWWDADDQTIHMASNESETLILTVSSDPGKKRGHPKLFRELTKVLKDAGAPAPE
jgi:hypothetical protein